MNIFAIFIIGCLTQFSSIGVIATAISKLELVDSSGALSSYVSIANTVGVSFTGILLGGLLGRFQGFKIGFYAPLISALTIPPLIFTSDIVKAQELEATGLNDQQSSSIEDEVSPPSQKSIKDEDDYDELLEALDEEEETTEKEEETLRIMQKYPDGIIIKSELDKVLLFKILTGPPLAP